MLPRGYPAAVLEIGAVLVDFDGTACLHDVAEHLLIEFGDPSWSELDLAWERGEVGGRDTLSTQAGMLAAPIDRMLRYAIDHCPLDPTFRPFVEWLRELGIPVTLVSDGFGFYVAPLLEAHGINDVAVMTNTWRPAAATRLAFDNGHPVCVGCGTCKKQAVEHARAAIGPVAFVGEGTSDRFGARYADVTFAKVGEPLGTHCEAEGIPYVPWQTFDEVRSWLERANRTLGPVGGEPCPGWREPT
jgi:2,3-diketo-5-methylthio-1-phosphopentane phosphatase